jgi:hypothetical protein
MVRFLTCQSLGCGRIDCHYIRASEKDCGLADPEIVSAYGKVRIICLHEKGYPDSNYFKSIIKKAMLILE